MSSSSHNPKRHLDGFKAHVAKGQAGGSDRAAVTRPMAGTPHLPAGSASQPLPEMFRRPVAKAEPVDQAAGLRRLFAARSLRFVPVVSNPCISHGGVLIERLCSTLDDLGLSTLVVDASERGSAPKELARFDLAEGIEALSPGISYLAARGLPVRWVDERGSTRGFLDAIADAAPQTQVVLVHAGALELTRLFGRGDDGLSRPRPVVLCDETPEALTQAYAALKIMIQRVDWLAHDLLLAAPPQSDQACAVAERLGQVSDLFLGGVLHHWVAVDPGETADIDPSRALTELVHGLVSAAARYSATDSQFAALARTPALPPTPHDSMN